MNTQCNVFLIFWGYFCFCFYFLVFSEICHCCYFPYIFISLPLPFPHSFCPVSIPSSPILQLLTSARNVFITSLYILIYRKHILETHCHRATFCSLSLSSLRAYYNWLCSPNFFKAQILPVSSFAKIIFSRFLPHLLPLYDTREGKKKLLSHRSKFILEFQMYFSSK